MHRDTKSIKLAVVGVGYFGRFHCSKLAKLPGVELVAVVDIDQERSRQVARQFGAKPMFSHLQLVGMVDAVVVAVPTSGHYQVATDLLSEGISLLVEKPLATTLAQADQLCELAESRKVRLQVGHLERFNPAVAEALPRIRNPRYIRMERSGPYMGRGGDVDVVLELMTHDLDLLLQMTGSSVESISACGWPVLTNHPDVTSVKIRFQDGLVADLLASRMSTHKCRKFVVLDQDGCMEVDMAQRQIWRVFRNGHRPRSYRVNFQPTDPLMEQDRSFVHILQNGQQPRVGGNAARSTVGLAARILECIRVLELSSCPIKAVL